VTVVSDVALCAIVLGDVGWPEGTTVGSEDGGMRFIAASVSESSALSSHVRVAVVSRVGVGRPCNETEQPRQRANESIAVIIQLKHRSRELTVSNGDSCPSRTGIAAAVGP
jgi:hypothetical protein